MESQIYTSYINYLNASNTTMNEIIRLQQTQQTSINNILINYYNRVSNIHTTNLRTHMGTTNNGYALPSVPEYTYTQAQQPSTYSMRSRSNNNIRNRYATYPYRPNTHYNIPPIYPIRVAQ